MDLYSTTDRSIPKDTCLSQDKEVFRLDTQHQLCLIWHRCTWEFQYLVRRDHRWSTGHDSSGRSHRATKTHHPRDLANFICSGEKAACAVRTPVGNNLFATITHDLAALYWDNVLPDPAAFDAYCEVNTRTKKPKWNLGVLLQRAACTSGTTPIARVTINTYHAVEGLGSSGFCVAAANGLTRSSVLDTQVIHLHGGVERICPWGSDVWLPQSLLALI
jgi:hypothetical protein